MRISDWSSDVCSSDLPLADVDDHHLIDEGRFLIGQVEFYAARAPFENETAAEQIIVGFLVARLGAHERGGVAIGRAVEFAKILQRELSRCDLGRRRVEPGRVHARAKPVVVRNGVRDRGARAEPLGLANGRLLLRAKAAVKPVETDFEFGRRLRSEEHTSELQSLMRISYAV